MYDPNALVKVYEARHEAEAALLRQLLTDEGIPTSIETTASPLDGLVIMNEGTEVQVPAAHAQRAAALVQAFLSEHGHSE
jgi:hypothetical protein